MTTISVMCNFEMMSMSCSHILVVIVTNYLVSLASHYYLSCLYYIMPSNTKNLLVYVKYGCSWAHLEGLSITGGFLWVISQRNSKEILIIWFYSRVFKYEMDPQWILILSNGSIGVKEYIGLTLSLIHMLEWLILYNTLIIKGWVHHCGFIYWCCVV